MKLPYWAIAGLLAVASPGVVGAQPNAESFFPASGTELFRGLLHFHGIQPVQDLSEVNSQNASKTIVIVLLRNGSPIGANGFVEPTLAASTVLRNGGSLLIATESRGRLGRYFPSETPTEVEIGSIGVMSETSNLDGNEFRPFVTPRYPTAIQLLNWQVNNRPQGSEWSLFAHRERIAANNSSPLRVTTASPYVEHSLAGFPPGSRSSLSAPVDRQAYSFAVGGSGVMPGQPTFRSLVLGDPDVFSNRLIASADDSGAPRTENLAFANAVVQWLRGPESSPRTRCLFVDNGEIVARFDDVTYLPPAPSMPPVPIPDFTTKENQQKLANAVNNFLAEKEDADAFNRVLAGSDRKAMRMWRILAVGAAVAGLLFFLVRTVRNRHHPDLPAMPTDTGRVAGSAPPGTLARRREEMLQSGDYGEFVREYLRDLFLVRGLAPTSATAKGLPAVRVSGPDAKAMMAHLRILWEVAHDPAAKPIPYSRWKELEPMIDAVRRAAEEGRWQFTAPGGTA